jgi:hypothetical protein
LTFPPTLYKPTLSGAHNAPPQRDRPNRSL